MVSLYHAPSVEGMRNREVASSHIHIDVLYTHNVIAFSSYPPTSWATIRTSSIFWSPGMYGDHISYYYNADQLNLGERVCLISSRCLWNPQKESKY